MPRSGPSWAMSMSYPARSSRGEDHGLRWFQGETHALDHQAMPCRGGHTAHRVPDPALRPEDPVHHLVRCGFAATHGTFPDHADFSRQHDVLLSDLRHTTPLRPRPAWDQLC